jgi:uncharacterized membrane protein YeaQ/YmgE (transglycosylase-associated protein family)
MRRSTGEEPVFEVIAQFDVLSKVQLSPGGFIAWIFVGLIAGAIAGRIARGRGYGCIGDIIVGLIGSLVGGFVFSLFVNSTKTYGFLASVGVSIVGALIVIFLSRLIFRR